VISRREWIIIGLVAVAVALAILFGTGLLNETLELPPRSIGVFAALVGLVVVVAILWLATLRDLARRRDGSDSRKDKKFGS
jgi:protein-S-isoprenylcysteine O-methyltransferase Ste14